MALLLLELATFNFTVTMVAIDEEIPGVYTWLAEQGEVKIIELPVRFPDFIRQAEAIYYSTYHWKKTANVFSGYNLPFSRWLFDQAMQSFPSPYAAAVLRCLDIDYVLWNRNWAEGYHRQEDGERIVTTPGFRLVKSLGI